MILHDLYHNHFVQIALVFLLLSPIQMIGRKLIERVVRQVVKADRYETKLDERKREDTIINMFHALFIFVAWAVAVLISLSIFNINIAALITGAGIFGVIFGFGAQSTIKDYLAGIYILTENQYRVGDIVTLSGGTTSQIGASGMVEEITLRITRLRDLDGTLTTVRNGDASMITNRTFKYSSVVVELHVDFDSDLKAVEKAVNEVGADMLKDEALAAQITEPMTYFRVSNLADGYVVQAKGKVVPAAQWDVASAFRTRIVPAFIKHGIKMSFQHIMVEQTSHKPKSK